MASSTLDEELQNHAVRVITHMNEDHSDSVLAYAHYYAKLPTAVAACLTGLNSKGFVLTADLSDGTIKENIFIPYNKPLQSAKGIRKIAVAMHFEAFHGMGFCYKISKNYYMSGVKMAWTHTPDKVKYTGLLVFAAGIGAGLYFWQKSKKK